MTSSFPTVTYGVPVPAAGTLLPFQGDLHAHSSYSDGNEDGATQTPLQGAAELRRAAATARVTGQGRWQEQVGWEQYS